MKNVTALDALFPEGATRTVGLDGAIVPLPMTITVGKDGIGTMTYREGDTASLHFELAAVVVRGWEDIGVLLRRLVAIAGVCPPEWTVEAGSRVHVPLLRPRGGHPAAGCSWPIAPGLVLWHTGVGVRLFEVERTLPAKFALPLDQVAYFVRALLSAHIIDGELDRRRAKVGPELYAELMPRDESGEAAKR